VQCPDRLAMQRPVTPPIFEDPQGPQLAGLVRRVYGARAGWRGAPVMSDYDVIVIGRGRSASTVPALSRKADCAAPSSSGSLRATLPIRRVVGPADVAALAVHLMTNTAITRATYDIEGGQQLVAGG
jgi:hypothetical protein